MKYKSVKKIQRTRESSLLRKRRRCKRKHKTRNILRNRNKNTRKDRNENPYKGIQVVRKNELCVNVPKDFTMNNIDNVVRFMNKTYNEGTKPHIKHINLSMDDVEDIDMYSICLLLSLTKRLSRKQKSCSGNYPKNADMKNFLINSGFLDIMHSNVPISFPNGKKNQMYVVGKSRVECKRINESITETMEKLVGKAQYYPPLYEIMVEICANSVEHANIVKIEKNWLVSISSSKEDDGIRFILTDSGSGILRTLRKKKIEIFSDIFRDNLAVIKAVFNKGYQSATGEINRHKGLPSILDAFNDQYISDLEVLTNKIYYNFKSGTSRNLKYEFNGTMISWTITNKNIEIWKQSICM